jgi:hypothetical protein
MKRAITLLVLSMVALASTPAHAAAGPVYVARYPMDTLKSSGFPDVSGRGAPLRIRAADGGSLRWVMRGSSPAIATPAKCAAGATRCPRVVLEGTNDADLNPGIRTFRWGAMVATLRSQLGPTDSNVMQKGVSTTQSQWKLQVGIQGRAHCVVVGQGSATNYLVRSNVIVADGRWHQVTCVRTGSWLGVYVDGKNQGTIRVPANLSIANTLPMRVGARNLQIAADRYVGFVDEVFAIAG